MPDDRHHDRGITDPSKAPTLVDQAHALDNTGDIHWVAPVMQHGKTRQNKQSTRPLPGWAVRAPRRGWREPEAHSAELQKRAEDYEAEQAALLEAIPLESQYLATLAVYAEAKQEQVERLEDRLENLIEQQLARLQHSQSRRPGLFAMPGTRAAWQQQQARQQARIQCLQNRLENVREIKESMDIHGPKIEGLAARKLRAREPELAGEWDKVRLAQRHHQAMQRKKQVQKQEQQARSQFLRQER